jgi:GT2 family glycosyltransferase
MSIGFVVVSYNSEAVLGDCLKRIPRHYEIIVVDNASEDKSTEVAKSYATHVISNAENLGFGAACNQGARLLTTTHVFFLNPDAHLSQGALYELEKAIEKFPDAGGFGPRVKNLGQTKSFRSKSYIQQGRYLEDCQVPTNYAEVDFIDGAALICNRDLFLNLHGFDENIFLYYEDDDLSYRIRCCGKALIYVPQALVLHAKKSSSKPKFRLHYLRSWHETRSRMKLSKKYGLPFDHGREKKRALIRLFRSVITLKFRQAARYLGVTHALDLSRPEVR